MAAKHSAEDGAAGTAAQRQRAAEAEAERLAVEARNLREQLRRDGKVQGDQSDR